MGMASRGTEDQETSSEGEQRMSTAPSESGSDPSSAAMKLQEVEGTTTLESTTVWSLLLTMHSQCGRHTGGPLPRLGLLNATRKEGEKLCSRQKNLNSSFPKGEARTFYRKYAPQHFLSLERGTKPTKQSQTLSSESRPSN